MRPALSFLLLLPSLAARAPEAPPRVAVLTLAGPLDAADVAYVRRAVREIRDRGASLVVVELDTPGGRVDHMLMIGEELMSLAPIRTAVFIRPLDPGGVTGGAWSAGAYVAFSCSRIYLYPGTVIGAAAPVRQTSEGPQPLDEKYVSAFREKFRARAEQNGYPPHLAAAMVDPDLEVYEIVVDGRRRYVTKGEVPDADLPPVPFVARGKLLTMTSTQVAETGMGRISEGRTELYADFGITDASEWVLEPTWSERMVGFLTLPEISFLLLVVALLGILLELQAPGFGGWAAVGLAAMGLLLFGHHLAGLAEIPEILLIALGLALLAVEVFVIPGTWVSAIAGVACIFAGLILSLQGFTLPELPWQTDLFLGAVGRVVLAFLGATVAFLLLVPVLGRVPLLGRLVLQSELAVEPQGRSELVGRTGVARTPLRPGGKIDVGGRTFDVVAEGDYVQSGERVKIVRVEGFRIVVNREKR